MPKININKSSQAGTLHVDIGKLSYGARAGQHENIYLKNNSKGEEVLFTRSGRLHKSLAKIGFYRAQRNNATTKLINLGIIDSTSTESENSQIGQHLKFVVQNDFFDDKGVRYENKGSIYGDKIFIVENTKPGGRKTSSLIVKELPYSQAGKDEIAVNEKLRPLDSRHILKYFGTCSSKNSKSAIILEKGRCNGAETQRRIGAWRKKQAKTRLGNQRTDQLKEARDTEYDIHCLMLYDMVRFMETLEENGLVHRDFKLENVILGEDGYTKGMDFGITLNVGDPLTEARDKQINQPRNKAPECIAFSTSYKKVKNGINKEYRKRAEKWLNDNPQHKKVPDEVKEKISIELESEIKLPEMKADSKMDIHPLGTATNRLFHADDLFDAKFDVDVEEAVLNGNSRKPNMTPKKTAELADFIKRTTALDPKNRPTAKELMKHPLLKKMQSATTRRALRKKLLEITTDNSVDS